MLSPCSCTKLLQRHPVLNVLIIASHLSCVPQMEAVKRAGLTRYIGVSNFRMADLQLLLKTAKIKVRAPVQLILWGKHVHAAPAQVDLRGAQVWALFGSQTGCWALAVPPAVALPPLWHTISTPGRSTELPPYTPRAAKFAGKGQSDPAPQGACCVPLWTQHASRCGWGVLRLAGLPSPARELSRVPLLLYMCCVWQGFPALQDG